MALIKKIGIKTIQESLSANLLQLPVSLLKPADLEHWAFLATAEALVVGSRAHTPELTHIFLIVFRHFCYLEAPKAI